MFGTGLTQFKLPDLKKNIEVLASVALIWKSSNTFKIIILETKYMQLDICIELSSFHLTFASLHCSIGNPKFSSSKYNHLLVNWHCPDIFLKNKMSLS